MVLYTNSHYQYIYIHIDTFFHFIELTAQPIYICQNGPTQRREGVDPRPQTPERQSVIKPETHLQTEYPCWEYKLDTIPICACCCHHIGNITPSQSNILWILRRWFSAYYSAWLSLHLYVPLSQLKRSRERGPGLYPCTWTLSVYWYGHLGLLLLTWVYFNFIM